MIDRFEIESWMNNGGEKGERGSLSLAQGDRKTLRNINSFNIFFFLLEKVIFVVGRCRNVRKLKQRIKTIFSWFETNF